MSNETPSRPGNVLLAVDGRDSCEEEACMALSGVEDPADVDVIFVTFTKSADQRLEAWRDHADAPPSNIGIVSVEMGAADGGREAERNGGPAVRRISDPSDLTGVGIAISEFLSAWADTDQQTVVCFDSVTALLQYVEANRVFQFLNEMTSKFEQAGAHAHFHLMPEAHEPQDLSVLTSLFGDRKTAASIVGAGAAAGAAEAAEADDAETAGDEAQEATDAEAETGFIFADDADETPTTEADEAEPTAEADEAEPATEANEADSPAESDAAGPADADNAEPATETTADTSDPEADADGDDSSGGDDQMEGDDGTATPADEPAGAPQDRVESSVQKIEDTDEPSTFGGKSSATARAANEGRDAASAAPAATSTATASASTAGSDDETDDDDGGNWYKNATYSRTTATVIGVVTMLVLISFLAAAMPLPVGTDTPDNSGNAITTATPEPTASTGATGTTATETPTPAPTDSPTNSPTATDTPTPTPESSTSGSDGTSSTSSTDSSSTPTATDTPTATPSPTATPTPEGDLTDTVDDTTDTVNDTTDTVNDTLSDDSDDDLL